MSSKRRKVLADPGERGERRDRPQSTTAAEQEDASPVAIEPMMNSELEAEPAKKSFEDLGIAESLCEACRALEYTRPTPIQAEAIPLALKGRDVIGLAETGSGKTCAFALPIIQILLDKPQKLFGLVLAPTRELARQICDVFRALGSLISLRATVIVGGEDMISQAAELAKKPHVIIATPGRLLDHLESTKGFSLRTMKCLVMDEADRLLDMDFGPIIEKILKFIPRDRQTYLFSATMSSKVETLQRASLRDPVRVNISQSKYQTVEKLRQNYLLVPHIHKETNFVYLINEFAGHSTMVFTRTVNDCQRLAILLRALGFGALSLHGSLTQSARLGALNKFRSGNRDILVATDVAARGLDIPRVDLVINYDLPGDSKTYIHRVGRTARAGKAGIAISIVTQYDVELYQRIEAALGKKFEEFPRQNEEVMVFKTRVEEAQRHARTEMKALLDSRGKRGSVLRGKKPSGRVEKRRADDMDAEEG